LPAAWAWPGTSLYAAWLVNGPPWIGIRLTGADRVLSVEPDHYVGSQGTVLGRAGRVHVDRKGDLLWIGGRVANVISGDVFF
jgi:predicted PhzF superfamily epimerase YddE/YHI9